MSTTGVVDIVFLIDASDSMRPCIDGVRKHLSDFIRGLETGTQQRMDFRIDFLAHCCDSSGGPFGMSSLRAAGVDLIKGLYSPGKPSTFFTTNPDELRAGLGRLEVTGDEATIVALDFALDFPWRPRRSCHRVVIALTDEPLETGALVSEQKAKLSAIIDKMQDLGIMLFLVAPESAAFGVLAEADKSEYQVIDAVGDGLRTVDFGKVLAFIGKTISISSLHAADDTPVKKALFGQDAWGPSDASVRGR